MFLQGIRYFVVALLVSCALSLPVGAVDLLAVFQKALKNDPTFKAAKSHWMSEQQSVPLARTELLPKITAQADIYRRRVRADLGENITALVGSDKLVSYSSPYSYGVTLQQPLLNFPALFALQGAKSNVKKAHAIYLASLQDLIMRTAQRYFSVLQAHDDLTFVRAERKAVGKQLKRTTARYKVGLATVTALYDAKARYNLILADEITAGNVLTDRLEELWEITNTYYTVFNKATKQLVLLPPNPTNINAWVQAAIHQNLALSAARYGVDSARSIVKQKAAAHLPVLNAVGDLHISKGGDTSTIGSDSTKMASIGLEATLPVFEGGGITAATRAAQHDYQYASNTMQALLRRTVSEARQHYLGVIASMSKVRADKKVIRSSRSALKANQAGYSVGTRTMIDVLDSQANLYEAQKNYSRDVYEYLLNILRLKLSAGTLNVNDLADINRWLTKTEHI